MLHKTKIGVCMDDSVAYLLEEKNDENVITIIAAETDSPADSAPVATEFTKHRKNHAFFKQVFEAVKDFDKVFLYCPVSAHKELLNRIRANKLSHIEILNNFTGEEITDSQRIEFINQYFGT